MSNFDRTTARNGVGIARAGTGVDQGLRAHMLGVYNYMTLGLGVTGVVAYGAFKLGTVDQGGGGLALNGFGHAIFASNLRWLLALAPLAIVFYLSARINSMSAASARNAFFVFAAMMGLSMSAIFVVYAHATIGRVFFETAASFGALSLVGYTTKRDLSAMGSFLIMGLFGLIIAMVVNMFLGSNGAQWALSVIGILIFAGLTAYDTQTIKNQYYAGYDGDARDKASIFGALNLYLDFINIFQFLLSLSGGRSNN